MKEKEIEQYLIRRVREAGGIQRKWVSPGHRGVPDRVVIFDGGRVSFVELKRPKANAEDHQRREHKRLRDLGCIVHILDTREAVDEFIRWRTKCS